jgi:hypothetical protein
MSDIILVNRGGELVAYSPVADIASQLEGNYAERGGMAGLLVVAALTETPLAARIGGRVITHDALEGSWRHPEETGPPPAIEEARVVLGGYAKARVPGASALELDTLDTNYRAIARNLWPRWRTPKGLLAAFEGALLEQLVASGVKLQSAAEARELIRQAPKDVRGLRLSDHNRRWGGPAERHEFVTVDGRVLQAHSNKTYLSDDPIYYLTTDFDELGTRGGRAPREGIGNRISRRVTDLRTRDSKR